MKLKATVACLIIGTTSVINPLPSFSQSIFEAGGVDSMAVGLGAGLGASIGKGMLVNQTYRAGVNAQLSAAQALQLQTKAIERYMKLGCEYQAKKNWQDAEKSFRYVLQVSAMRDGPGSPKATSPLQHLAQVSAAQGNLFDAINFQSRVVSLAKNQPFVEPGTIIAAQMGLCNYYLQKQDYRGAEPVLEESYELTQRSPTLPANKKVVVAKAYGNILRKLGKIQKAEEVDPSPVAISTDIVTAQSGQNSDQSIIQSIGKQTRPETPTPAPEPEVINLKGASQTVTDPLAHAPLKDGQ
jgi:tetratricopeptide (TPR) repeat protein